MPEPALIALTGPTAAGKTAAALAVAERWPVEIISVDSALVYQGMDLGTAKPSAQELASAVHHLIDIRDPSQPYSAAEFQRDALRLIDDIRSRGRHPLLVGGTMLYLKALMHGLDDMPTAEPSVRAEIAAEAAALGWPALHAELAKVDPLTAERLPPQDAQRIARALEVWRVSGRTLSSFHQQKDRHQGVEMSLIALEPQQRSWLHERIATRFDQMLSQGLMQEVWDLMQRGDLHPQLPSMRCVGYRQCWQALQSASAGTAPSSVAPALSPAQLALLRSQGIAATRQLAKRQITWLRSMPQRHTVACDAPDALRQTLQRVQVLWGCT